MSWEKKSLGELIKISKGKKHAPLVKGKYRYINIEDLHNPNNSIFTNEAGNFVSENDLIIAWDGANAGKIGVGYQGVIGSTLAKLSIIKKDIAPRFLFWVLESLNTLIKSQRTGATIPHINGAALKDLQIPLPPLPIQKRIAEILDAADALKRKDRELLKKYDELAQAIFIDMFGDPVKNEKGWAVKPIKNIASNEKHSIKAGPFGSSLKKEFYKKAGYKIYGQEQVIADDLSIGNYYVDEKKFTELKSCEIKAGDILISLVGTYGKISIVPERFEKGIINPRLMKISLNKTILNPVFFKNLLKTDQMFSAIGKHSRGGTMDIINVGIISDVSVIIPPIEQQLEYVDQISNIQQQLKIANELNLSETLFNSLLQKAFTGELVS